MALSDSDDIRATLADELGKASASAAADAPAEAAPVNAPAEEAEAAPLTAAEQRARDDKGRFAAAKEGKTETAAEAPVEAKSAAAKATPDKAATTAPEPAATEAKDERGAPPPGWSPASKAAWHAGTVPAEIVRDVRKREEEIARGFQQLASFKPLEPYVEMAKSSNTTLDQALERYVAAEQQLERDPRQGLLWLCQNYNVDPRELAAMSGGQQTIPQPQQQRGAPAYSPDLAPILTPIQRELAQLRQTINADKSAQAESQVQTFFNDPANIFAENVANDMAEMIQSGKAKTLKQAYDRACRLNDEVWEQITKSRDSDNQKAAAEAAKAKATVAKAAARSVAPSRVTPAVSVQQGDNLRSVLEEQFAGAARA